MSAQGIPELVRRAAATWHERLQREGDCADTLRAFNQWLAQSPEHQHAYAVIDRAWSVLRAAAHEPEILALRHETALRLSRESSRSLRPIRFAAAIALVLALGGLAVLLGSHWVEEGPVFAWLPSALKTETDRTYSTTVGERLAMTLVDGSQITLDTQSQLRVMLSKRERHVQLLRGQALFEVAKDRTRPFVVEARNQRLVAIGTAFDVRVDDGEMKVTMVEGAVRVETPLSPVMMTLTAGQQLVIDARSENHVHPADPERATSWRRGQISFDDARLADAVREINRYSQARIVLADPALAELRLSGAFATGRPNVFVEAISSYYGLAIASRDAQTIVLKAR